MRDGNMFEDDPISPASRPVKEDFNHHTLVIELLAGESEYPTVTVQCHKPDDDQNMCDTRICQVRELIASVGAWDIIRSAGDIELARLSARVDWSDPEEPWVDVEP